MNQNGTMMLMEGVDLLDGDTGTPVVSRRSEARQRILCVKEGIGKYGVVCKAGLINYLFILMNK